MKTLKLLLATIIIGTTFSSCVSVFEDDIYDAPISLEEVVSAYDLWYVDYHRTTGNGDIPYVSKAFTLSFLNGVMYANNNIVDIGRTGNGLGIDVGTYTTFNDVLETNHDLDGRNDFEVYQVSSNEIRLYSYRENTNYYLIGYQIDEFDYDKLFYENIEYFLQEFVAWEKTGRSTNGSGTGFDNESYLQFIPENTPTFYSSLDSFGTNIDALQWDFVGDYEMFDVVDYDDLKILTLNYDGGDIEEFELSVINDDKISLYHIGTDITYTFSGRGFIQYLKGNKKANSLKPNVRNNGRKRTKIKRKTKIRRNLK